MASTNLPSKLSRAICAYLVGAGAITSARCYPAYTRRTRTLANGPIVTVEIWPGQPMPAPTGDWQFTAHVAIKGSAVHETDDDNDDTERVAFDALVGAVKDALMVSDDGGQTINYVAQVINTAAYALAASTDATIAANNADLDNFTALSWQTSTYGQGRADDCQWEVVLQFNVIACERKMAMI